MLVRHRMSQHPVTISPSDTLARARAKMQAGHFRRLPVEDDGQLVGIVTDRDIRGHAGIEDRTRVKRKPNGAHEKAPRCSHDPFLYSRPARPSVREVHRPEQPRIRSGKVRRRKIELGPISPTRTAANERSAGPVQAAWCCDPGGQAGWPGLRGDGADKVSACV